MTHHQWSPTIVVFITSMFDPAINIVTILISFEHLYMSLTMSIIISITFLYLKYGLLYP